MIRIRHLETDVTTACNLSCVACNHHVPIWRTRGPLHSTPGQVAQDLSILGQFLHADIWGALGGEPLLHKELLSILRIVRESGICDEIEVWTNATLLRQQPAKFWESPDWDVLVASLYPWKVTDADVAWIQGQCQTYGKRYVPKDERSKPNFRTILEPTPTDYATTKQKFHDCFFRKFSRNVTNGFFFTCCCLPHVPVLHQGRPYGSDGVRVDADLTEAELKAYLEREEPLEACTICAGRETAKKIPWSEERRPLQWVAASRGMA